MGEDRAGDPLASCAPPPLLVNTQKSMLRDMEPMTEAQFFDALKAVWGSIPPQRNVLVVTPDMFQRLRAVVSRANTRANRRARMKRRRRIGRGRW